MELTFSQPDLDQLKSFRDEIYCWLVGTHNDDRYVKLGIDPNGKFWILKRWRGELNDDGYHYDLHDPRIHMLQIEWSQTNGYEISRVSCLFPVELVDYVKEVIDGS